MRLLKVQPTGNPGLQLQAPRQLQDQSAAFAAQGTSLRAQSQQRGQDAQRIGVVTRVKSAQRDEAVTLRKLEIQQREAERQAREQERAAKAAAKAEQERLEFEQEADYADATFTMESLKLSFLENGGSRQQLIGKAMKALGEYNLSNNARRALIRDVFGVASDSAERQARAREDFIEEVRDAERETTTSRALLQLTDLGAQLAQATGPQRDQLLGTASEFVNSYLNNTELDALTQLEVANGALRYLLPYVEDGSQLAVDINRWTKAQSELTEVQYDESLSPTERKVLEQQIRVRNGFSGTPVLTDLSYDIEQIQQFEETQRDYRRFYENTSLEAQLTNDAAIGALAQRYVSNPTPLKVRCRQSGEPGICTAADLAEEMGKVQEGGLEVQSNVVRLDSQIAALEGTRARDIATMVRRSGPEPDPVTDPLIARLQVIKPELAVVMRMMKRGERLTPEQQAQIEVADQDLLEARNRQLQALYTQRELEIARYQLQADRLSPYVGNGARAAASEQFRRGGGNPVGGVPSGQ